MGVTIHNLPEYLKRVFWAMRKRKRGRETDLINRRSSASTIRSALIEMAWTHLPPLKDEP